MIPVVCIVDDDPDTVEMMTHLIASKGYEVFAATSMAETLTIFRNNTGKITTLITDFNLGFGQTANDLLSALGNNKPENVVLLSGKEFQNFKEEVPGAHFHIMKPLNLNKLFDTIK